MRQRFSYITGLVTALVLALVLHAAGAQTVLNYFSQADAAGDNILTLGGTWKIGATAVTASAATLNTAAVGVAAGYKVARGQATLDGSNPTTAATGLTTVEQCVASLEATSAPAVTFVTTTISTTNLDIYAWAPTSSTNTALTASGDNSLVVSWVCVGT